MLYIDTLQEEVIKPFLRSQQSGSNGHKPMEPIGDAITEGSRNATLTSLGGAVRRRGASDSIIEAGWLAQNADTCKPPLSSAEVEGIAHSVARYSPVEELHLGGPGVHAKIEIRLDGILMGWTNFNLERDEDRQLFSKLSSNRCHGQVRTMLKDGYAKELLKLDLDTFCADLWTTHISSEMPVELVGNPDIALESLIYPYIIRGGGTIVFAPPGKGRSYTPLLMGVSVDAGISDIWNTTQAKVLFINLDGSAQSIQRRIGLVNTALNQS